MSPEKPQFTPESAERETEKSISLAREVEEAFARNDFDITLEKLRELKKAVSPEAAPRTRLEGIVAEQIETAIEKLGKENVFGPKEVEKTFGIRVREVPEIPFSVEELERAEKMGQMLVLRVDKTEDGKPMSLETMNDILVKKWSEEDKGEILRTADGWKNWIGEDRFKKETPRSGWALVSKDLLPESTSKNYIEQTDVIIKALRERVFKDIEIPEEYEEAIREFESKRDELTRLLDEDQQKAAKELLELKITKLTRQIFPETIYDVAMYYDRHNKRLLSDKYAAKYAWSASLHPGGGALVCLGAFVSEGVRGWRCFPDDRRGDLGVSISRRL